MLSLQPYFVSLSNFLVCREKEDQNEVSNNPTNSPTLIGNDFFQTETEKRGDQTAETEAVHSSSHRPTEFENGKL